MPADGFSFTVRVGCQIDVIHIFGKLPQFLYRGYLILADLIDRRKVVFNVNAQSILSFDRKITDMSFTGNDQIVLSKIFSDCFGFRRRLYNNKILHNKSSFSFSVSENSVF